jgi:hypothetical protein
VSMLGVSGWWWMLPRLAELQWDEESTQVGAAAAA